MLLVSRQSLLPPRPGPLLEHWQLVRLQQSKQAQQQPLPFQLEPISLACPWLARFDRHTARIAACFLSSLSFPVLFLFFPCPASATGGVCVDGPASDMIIDVWCRLPSSKFLNPKSFEPCLKSMFQNQLFIYVYISHQYLYNMAMLTTSSIISRSPTVTPRILQIAYSSSSAASGSRRRRPVASEGDDLVAPYAPSHLNMPIIANELGLIQYQTFVQSFMEAHHPGLDLQTLHTLLQNSHRLHHA